MKRSQGFTLIELMVVVAIIVVLAVIAVGAYRRFVARARVSEVYATFADIRAKEESYRAEFSVYLSASANETDLYPVLGSYGNEPSAKPWNPPAASPWRSLAVNSTARQVYCSYGVIAAMGGQWGASGSFIQGFMAGTPPATTWWWAAIAMCDNDGVPGSLYDMNNAHFITSSQITVVRDDNIQR